MKQKLLQTIAKPFIGSGIGEKLPALHGLYKKMYGGASDEVVEVHIPLDMSLKVQAGDNGPGLYLQSTGEFEPFETQLFTAAVLAGDVVLDIGAHVGYYTLLAAKLAGKTGSVIAVEASAKNAEILRENIANNKFRNVTVVEQAMGSKQGKVTFYLSSASSGDNSLVKPKESAQAVEVEMTTVDALVKQLKTVPTVVKIDVEGAEDQVFGGMKQTLNKKGLKHLFIELTPAANASRKLVSTLKKAGFEIKVIDEYKRQVLPYSKAAFETVAKRHGFVNILASRH